MPDNLTKSKNMKREQKNTNLSEDPGPRWREAVSGGVFLHLTLR